MAFAAYHHIETNTLTQVITNAIWLLAGKLDPSVRHTVDKRTGYDELVELLCLHEELTGTIHPVDGLLAGIREEVDTNACTAS